MAVDIRPSHERPKPALALAEVPALLSLRFQDDVDGLVLADSGDTDAFLVDDGTGRLVVDDTVLTGLRILAGANRIVAI